MHGLHAEPSSGRARISVVLVGKSGGQSNLNWAPCFKSNLSLWLISQTKPPRLLQFSGILVHDQEQHAFTPDDLEYFEDRGSKVSSLFRKLQKSKETPQIQDLG